MVGSSGKGALDRATVQTISYERKVKRYLYLLFMFV